jgi:hypothetical protein
VHAFAVDKLSAVPEHPRIMSKTLLYAVAAIGNIACALVAYRSGRVVLPITFGFAAVCFIVATVGEVVRGGPPKSGN